MRERYGIIGGLIALGLSGCESSSGPSEDAETWVLRSVAGAELPALVSDLSNLLVLSDTLTLGFRHPTLLTGIGAISSRRIGVAGGPPSASSGLYHLERDGNQVTLRIACPPNADCLFDERRGEIDGDTMTLSYTPSGISSFRSPLIYQRVR